MIPYAASTGTKRNLAALRASGWRLLFNAAHPHLWREWSGHALDNGAWSAYTSGKPIDLAAYRRAVDAIGGAADWVILPDVVGGGSASLDLSLRWVDWTLERSGVVLIAAQDGITPADLAPLLGPRVGVAIGGTSEWKLAQLGRREWGRICRDRGAHLHALRVNTKRRVWMARAAGCHSWDGTSATRYSVTAAPLARSARQLDIFAPIEGWTDG